MPKVRLCRDPLEDKFREELNEKFKGSDFLTIANLCVALGCSRKTAEIWAADLPKFQFNGNKKKFHTADVAAKLARSVIT